jgi:hypothetical protein
MIKNLPIFFERVEKTLDKLSLPYRHGFIDYYDRYKINGKINLFQKPNEFSYQNEFRFYVNSGDIKPLIVKVGSLQDIAQKFLTNSILNLKLNVKDPQK